MALVSVFERIARDEGKEEGLQEGMLVLTTSLLEQRFGPLELELSQPLGKLTTDQLQALSKRLLSLSSKDDLKMWLEKERLHG